VGRLESPVPLRNAYEEMYCMRLREALQDARYEKGLTYKELALELERKYEFIIDPDVLKNRMNRGSFSAAFAAMVMTALGHTKLDFPDLEGKRPSRRGTAY
jgi:hypothetical protein